MFRMELALPVEDMVFPSSRWTPMTISLTAVLSGMRIGAYAASRSVSTVHMRQTCKAYCDLSVSMFWTNIT